MIMLLNWEVTWWWEITLNWIEIFSMVSVWIKLQVCVSWRNGYVYRRIHEIGNVISMEVSLDVTLKK